MPTWLIVLRTNMLTEGQGREISIRGRQIALFRTQGQFFAVQGSCSHEQACMAKGYLRDFYIECPTHSARFDLRTGKPQCLPATDPLKVYPLKVEGEDIWIEV